MKVVRDIATMRSACRDLRQDGSSLGLVPTMGALHEGHLSLVRRAKAECDAVAASIFVNPTQFGVGEDFEAYPRTLASDCAMLEAEGVDVVFAPTAATMYPEGGGAFVEVPGVGERLDGRSRPGHFRGVATVVTKLFNITQADFAYFGQKDAAQVAVLQAMVRDLNFCTNVVVCPTVRERDGLAMSSRNRNLSPEDRVSALRLHEALEAAVAKVLNGETDVRILRGAMLEVLADAHGVEVEYVEVVDPTTLQRTEEATGGALIAVAAKIGATRLIDNIVVEAVAHEAIA
jgi:pantoate--beta-alanine ligase